ncbi:hypothetical protein J1605_006387 [Eschrichtius robustus]|uniref:Uncharacterized protein n=1 Tax=Eschrichtius robustus TaxID=9764 RepID=A0AB34H5D0_ESCRO|nr:hypothetical protein J1605_010598 [Eschrichtius robustus]KAJ8786412.1 hypothetical protein J1605_006387 [Eschrichtius robustus]
MSLKAFYGPFHSKGQDELALTTKAGKAGQGAAPGARRRHPSGAKCRRLSLRGKEGESLPVAEPEGRGNGARVPRQPALWEQGGGCVTVGAALGTSMYGKGKSNSSAVPSDSQAREK